MIADGSTILFIGDSVTDCDRDRSDFFSLGKGYVNLVAEMLKNKYKLKNVRVLNRGISGDRVDTLLERWDHDCINLCPDLVTLLVGINNTIHRFKRNIATSSHEFEASFRWLVEKTIKEMECRLVIMEPFLLPVTNRESQPEFITSSEVWNYMREDLNIKINIIRKISKEKNITLIPLDGVFQTLSVHKSPEYWLIDGIHPTTAGHQVIAEHWLEVIGACE